MNQNSEPSKVTFDEDNGWNAAKYYRETSTPKMIGWVIKYSGGLVKNEKQAMYILIGFAVMVIVFSIFIFYSSSNSREMNLTKEELEFFNSSLGGKKTPQQYDAVLFPN